MTTVRVHDAVIIGSGFAGLGMAIQLRDAGFSDLVILEKEGDVGGVWRDNRYPGAACDVPSHLYSFSFEPNTRWTRKFAGQAEIHAYLRECADKHDLRGLTRFNTEVTAAAFDEAAGLWRISTQHGEKQGETILARVLISAVGQLNRPATPVVQDIDKFRGEVFHSARWNYDIALEGKRIAVIGTGASAIQFVPQIVPKAKSLVLIQRSAPYVIPKPDRRYFSIEQALFKRLPKIQMGSRLWQYLNHDYHRQK